MRGFKCPAVGACFLARVAFMLGVFIGNTSRLLAEPPSRLELNLNGTGTLLTNRSADLPVFFKALRPNLKVPGWVVDVVISNRSPTRLPERLWIGFSDRSAGVGSIPGSVTAGSVLLLDVGGHVPAAGSGASGTVNLGSVSFGIGAGRPNWQAAVFTVLDQSPPVGTTNLVFTRVLDGFGLPESGVEIVEIGPAVPRVRPVGRGGWITLPNGGDVRGWVFRSTNHLSVFRAAPGLGEPVTEVTTVRMPEITGDGAALTPQTLPGLLPRGWSLRSARTVKAGEKSVSLIGLARSRERVVVSGWDEVSFEWRLIGVADVNSTGDVTLPGDSIRVIAAVVADAGFSPELTLGSALPGRAIVADPAIVVSSATVNPASRLPSRIVSEVLGEATVEFRSTNATLISGLSVLCDIRETYLLRDGSRRVLPRYCAHVTGFSQGGTNGVLSAVFPLRPTQLLDGDELVEARVHVDVVSPGAPSGGRIGPGRGELVDSGVRLRSPAGAISEDQWVEFRSLPLVDVAGVFSNTNPILSAFEINVAGLVPGRSLEVLLPSQAPNKTWVLGRAVFGRQAFGFQPVGRFTSDPSGSVQLTEPATGERLAGIDGGGLFLLAEVSGPQALVHGIARNSFGTPTGGLLVRSGPWLSVTDSKGEFRTVAPAGTNTLGVSDSARGDSQSVTLVIPPALTPVTVELGAAADGPRVTTISPADRAGNVPRVASIQVGFSRPLNPATLLAGGLQLLAGDGGPVVASLSMNLANTLATLLPTEPLSPAILHTVVVSTNVMGANGRKLEGQSRFSFMTETDTIDRVGGQFILFEPINGVAPVAGSAGTAEPDAPVILVNETRGETATILSKADGSFSNSIPADVDDRVKVVLANRNGTRNTLSASRQIFRDGSVGLFEGGGLIELRSAIGDGSLNIEAGAIEGRSRIKLQMVDSNELSTITGGIAPAQGKMLGRAMSVSGLGSPVRGAVNVSFSVNPSELEKLGLPLGANPTNATYALVAITKVQGQIAYMVLNKLEYEDGRLVTHSPPFPGSQFLMEPKNEGLLAAREGVAIVSKSIGAFFGPFDFLMVPLVMAFQTQPLIVTGAVVEFSSTTNQLIATPLPGTVVTLSANSGGAITSGRRGSLDPGQLYTVAQKRGVYALLQPRPFVTEFDAEPRFDYVLTATHPRLFGQTVYKAANPPTVGFSITDLIFRARAKSSFANEAPGVQVSHAPAYPPIGTNVDVTVTMTHATGAPDLDNPVIDSVVPFPPETAAFPSDVLVGSLVIEDVSVQIRRVHFTVACNRNADVTLKLKAQVPNVAPTVLFYVIPFGQTPPLSSNPVPVDKSDKAGPRVVHSEPSPATTGVDPGSPIRLVFSEPVDRNTVTESSVSINPAAGKPVFKLSADQRELLVSYPGMVFGQDYILNFGANVTDLPPASNAFDQISTNQISDAYVLSFQTAPKIVAPFPGVTSGGGVAVRGSFAYVLDREKGNGDGHLRVFDITDPPNPVPVAAHVLTGTPRDLVLIPAYSFRRHPGGPAETRDLLAVSFGDVGAFFDGKNFLGGGQFIRIFNISDPTSPKNLVTRQVTLAFTTVVPRLRWSPPMLAYFENGADFQAFGLINLQTMILGQYMTDEEFAAGTGSAGVDNNGDGDFVDDNEQLPSPDPRSPDFAGKVFSFALTDTTQRVRDFNYSFAHGYFGAVLGDGKVKDIIGQPTATLAPACYRTFNSGNLTLPRDVASFAYTSAEPKRLFNLFGVVLSISNAPPRNADLALISVNGAAGSMIDVIEITDPAAPHRITSIVLPTSDGLVQSVQQRGDGMVLVGTTENLLLFDPSRLGDPVSPGGIHPALATRFESLGSGAFTFGSEDYGILAESLGGKSRLQQTPPLIEFVAFPQATPFDPKTLVGQDASLRDLMNDRVTLHALGPARFQKIPGVVDSTLNPPSPTVHYYVLVRAPGGDVTRNQEINILLESLNDHGNPLRNKGAGFPPVRAAAMATLTGLDQDVRGTCDAPIRPLTAFRLSNDKRSPFYNWYLSKPFALTYESITKAELSTLQSVLDREILWSGQFTRATFDTTVAGLKAIGSFAASIDGSRMVVNPGPFALADSLPADYIMGPNPSPVTGSSIVPGTFGMVSGHSGELRVDTTDIALPSRRMPVAFSRSAGAQDLFDGPFGRGWDFNYNQRLIELKGTFFDTNSGVPLILRGGPGDEIGRKSELVFHPGDGRALRYRFAGTDTNPPPEIAQDPLVASGELNWIATARSYYLPPTGIFDFFVRFGDGRFARLTADGTQYWYGAAGRLDRIYHRYAANVHELSYNARGELVRVTDQSVTKPRYLELGYWRPAGEVLDTTLDNITPAGDGFKIGRICRIKDYTGRDILFDYTPCGELATREGFNVSQAFTDGATGRARTEYIAPSNPNPNEQANGIRGVVAGSSSGAKLFAAQAFAADPKVPVVSSGDGATGSVGLTLQQPNTAQAIASGGAKSLVTGADTASTELSFDKDGLPSGIKYSGYSSPSATVKYAYTNGLLAKITQPEGNSITYRYDFANRLLRSRGNLVGMQRDNGPRSGQPSIEATFQYEPKYNLPAGLHKDFNGSQMTYSLDSGGRDVGKIEYSPGSGISAVIGSQEYVYDTFGQIKMQKTPEGFVTDYEYDTGSGFKISETQLDAGPTQFTYSPHASKDGDLGLATRIIHPTGDATDLTYNEREELTLVVRGPFQRQEQSYDLNGHLVRRNTRLDSNGKARIETRHYFQNGFQDKVSMLDVETDGVRRDLTYEFVPDVVFRVKEIRHPLSTGSGTQVITKFEEFDHLGRHHKITEGDYSEKYGYDLNGNLLTVDRGGTTDVYEYDGYDRLRTVRKEGKSGTEAVDFTYYPSDHLASRRVVDSQQKTVLEAAYKIDVIGRMTEETFTSDSGTSTSKTLYNGLITSVTDPVNEVTTTTYDRAGRVRQISDSIQTQKYSYDASGNLLNISSTEGASTFNTFFDNYNNLDQLGQLRDDVGVLMTPLYRLDDEMLSMTDARNGTTTFEPTTLGETGARILPNRVEFHYTYDEHRRLSKVTDKANRGQGFAFDTTLRSTGRTFRSGPPESASAFDKRNRQPTIRTIPGGDETLAYDAQGRLTDRTTRFNGSTRTESFTVDPFNRAVASTYPGGSAARKFDVLGPMREATFVHHGHTYTVQTTIRKDGRRETLTYPSPGSVTVQEQRDVAGRLEKLSINGGDTLVSDRTFATANLVGSQRIGGVIDCANSYDGRRRLTRSRYTAVGTGNVLAEVRYVYDATDNVVARQFVHRGGRADFFTYDSGQRLSRSDYGARPEISPSGARPGYSGFAVPAGVGGSWAPGFFGRTYGYDVATGLDVFTGVTTVDPNSLAPANFAQTYGAPDGFLQIGIIDGVSRPSDAMGNPINVRLFTRPPQSVDLLPMSCSLSYDGFKQMTGIIRNDGVTIDYEYQPDGLRFHREFRSAGVGGTNVTGFVHDGGLLLAEYDENGTTLALKARYYYADSDVPIAADIRDTGGNLRRFYYMTDLLGSVMGLVDANGAVVERYFYDAWGQPEIQTPDARVPRIRRISTAPDGKSLVVEFTERILPELAPGSPPGLVTSYRLLADAFQLENGGVLQAPTVTYEEAFGSTAFATVLRLVPSLPLAGAVTLTLRPDRILDEWGNADPGETRVVSFNQAPGTVLFSDDTGTSTDSPSLARSAVGSPFLFHGQYFDFDAGLIYMRARFYDPASGLFLQQDPNGYEDSVNLYAAFGQNPVSMRDPSGRANLLSLFFDLEERVAEKAAVRAEAAIARGETTAARRVEEEAIQRAWVRDEIATPLGAAREVRLAGRPPGRAPRGETHLPQGRAGSLPGRSSPYAPVPAPKAPTKLPASGETGVVARSIDEAAPSSARAAAVPAAEAHIAKPNAAEVAVPPTTSTIKPAMRPAAPKPPEPRPAAAPQPAAPKTAKENSILKRLEDQKQASAAIRARAAANERPRADANEKGVFDDVSAKEARKQSATPNERKATEREFKKE